MAFIFWRRAELYDLVYVRYLNGIFGDPESRGWAILKQTTNREISLSLSLGSSGAPGRKQRRLPWLMACIGPKWKIQCHQLRNVGYQCSAIAACTCYSVPTNGNLHVYWSDRGKSWRVTMGNFMIQYWRWSNRSLWVLNRWQTRTNYFASDLESAWASRAHQNSSF